MSTRKNAEGHNSLDSQLKSFVERIEALTLEKKSVADDIKEVFSEAKAKGYDLPTIRNIIKLRQMEDEKRRAFLDLLDRYQHALGMLGDLPLGKAAAERAAGMN